MGFAHHDAGNVQIPSALPQLLAELSLGRLQWGERDVTAVTSGRLELSVSPGVEYPACCRLGEVIKLDF